jgi:hypothetical protein
MTWCEALNVAGTVSVPAVAKPRLEAAHRPSWYTGRGDSYFFQGMAERTTAHSAGQN